MDWNENKIFMNFEVVSIQQSNLEQINKYIMCEKDFFLKLHLFIS